MLNRFLFRKNGPNLFVLLIKKKFFYALFCIYALFKIKIFLSECKILFGVRIIIEVIIERLLISLNTGK